MKSSQQKRRDFIKARDQSSERSIANIRISSKPSGPGFVDFDLSIDDLIRKYNASVYHLRKITNLKLKELADPGYKRNYLTKIKVYACFLKVGEIDNINQKFQAEAHIESRWEDKKIVGDKYDPDVHWDPEIYIANPYNALQQTVTYKIIRNEKKTIVCEIRKVKGMFYETLELNDFPVDVQDISITVTCTKSKHEVQFELSDEKVSSISTEGFRAQQEWCLFPDINASKKEYHDVFRKFTRPAISFQVFITLLGFMPFAFTVTEPNMRIGITIMLMLSSINFKIATTTKIPVVPYFTVLDKYALPALIYLGSLCSYHSIIGSDLFRVFSLETVIYIDRIAFFSIVGAYFTFTLIYFFYFLYKILKQKISEKNFKKQSKAAQYSIERV